MRMQCDGVSECVKRNGIHLIVIDCVFLQAPLSPAGVPFNMISQAMKQLNVNHVPNEWMQ